nr:SAM-dependent methyltransferase [Rhizobiaceae bacterium]
MAQDDRDADIDAQDDALAELAPARRSFTVIGHTIPARPLASGLYIVSTPIGNLGDITLRALETLAAADRLAAEDTRVTRKLLTRYGIARRPAAYHDHNAQAAGPALLETVRAGGSV